MDNGLLLLFWYGILHAFAPDHLTVIANFSIGKEMKKALTATAGFAVGHGIVLFVFAQLISFSTLPTWLLLYADKIAALVILVMGLYILSKLFLGHIHLSKHLHQGVEHIHITFKKGHEHSSEGSKAGFVAMMGSLMGIGGLRGMLLTMGVVSQREVTLWMLLAFILGVMSVFTAFGSIILYFNVKLLRSEKNLRRGFGLLGVTSVAVAAMMLSST